jgi:peptidyl-prolyl cis-trans isomerase C
MQNSLTLARALALACGLAAATLGATSPATADEGDDPVVAILNGDEIRLSEVESLRVELPEQYMNMPLEFVFPFLLDRAIDSRLVLADANASNLRDDPEVKERLAALENQVITRVYIERVIEAGVTEEVLREQYDLAMAALPPTEEVLAYHILLETEEEARAVIAEIEAGADFETMAKEKSIGPSAPNGGDIGYITRESVVPEFGDAAFALEPDEMGAEPVQSQFGWHVIKIVDKRMTEQPSFESQREEIADSVARDVIVGHFEALREGAEIVRFNLDGSPVEEEAAEEDMGEERPAEDGAKEE